MSARTIAVEHNGKTYSGELATIKSTALGWEDHGILTVMLHCEWPGAGIGVGGYCLDESTGKPDYGRRGTAYGLDHLMRVMETVGASRWEALPGKHVIVLFDAEPGKSTWGGTACGIAHALEDKVLIFKDHAKIWLDAKAEQVLA
jgi:hypothetical protein